MWYWHRKVLHAGERAQVVAALEKLISISGREHVEERVAYTWFNRFCALRFMDVNRYTRIGVVSPAEGQFQPRSWLKPRWGTSTKRWYRLRFVRGSWIFSRVAHQVTTRKVRPIAYW